jgi:tetratricopeptide (TPR) repeat protein
VTAGVSQQATSISPSAEATPEISPRSQLLAATGVFAGAIALYVWTLAPTVTLVDSGELIVAARSLGVAHPPGFPLYILLAHIASLVPIGSVAHRVNFASAFFAALSAAVLCLAVFEALRSPKDPPPGQPTNKSRRHRQSRQRQQPEPAEIEVSQTSPAAFILPGIAAGALFATSRTLWAYATIAEVYTLNTLLICLSVFALFRWRRLILTSRQSNSRAASLKAPNDRWLNAAALSFGLGLGVHHVTVGLVLPAFAALVFATEGWAFFTSKRLRTAALWAFGGLSIYLYLPLAASRSPVMNWGDPDTLDRFISHVTGRQYQIFFEARPDRIWHQLADFFGFALREFGSRWFPLTLLLALGGVLGLRTRGKGLFWFLVLAIVANLAYNANYEIAEDKDAYYLPVFLAIAVAAGVGLLLAAEWSARRLRWSHIQAFTVVALAILMSGVSIASNFRFDNRRHYFIAHDYVENLLSTVEPGGLVLTLDWQVYSPMLYLREIERYRPDVVAIDINQLRRSWYFDYLAHTYPEVIDKARDKVDAFLEDLRHWEQDPDLYSRDVSLSQRISARFQDLILSLIANHLEHSRVYVTLDVATYREGRDSDWAAQISKRYQLVPEGLVFGVYNDRGFHSPASPALVTRGLADGSLTFDDDDVVRVKVIPVYTAMFYNRGRYLSAANRYEEAIEAYKQALEIDNNFLPATRGINESQAALRKASSQ